MQVGRLMQVKSVRSAEDQPLSFTQDIITYEDCPQFQVNQFFIEPIAPILPANDISFSVAYSGFLVGYTEVGWRYVRDHIDPAFTILREDALAFPRVDLPSMALHKAAPREDFTFSAQITVPAELTVATGLEESERIEHQGRVTWVFKSREPVPFLNIAIAPYQLLVGQGVRVFHFTNHASGAQRLLGAIHRTLALYAEWFGPIGKGLHLHLIEIPEGWGSQASKTGGSILTADSFEGAGSLIGIYHELAHLCHPEDLDRPAPRWSEGLATFLQYRVAEELEEEESLGPQMDRLVGSLAEELQQQQAPLSVPMVEYGSHRLTDFSYPVGCLMFWALFKALGKSEFDTLLGGYFSTYRESGSTTAQFVDCLRTHSRVDLQPLFDEWLYTTRWADRLVSGERLLI
ncbi:MAG: hypothetical protein JW384_02552 [Nitrosomonadaceae bacterium]|nr:hypothetical protein [Nitrosomonadaceae bacterium]